jgi:hypothetical protein
MGFNIVWFAVPSSDRSSIIAALQLRETSVPDEYCESPASVADGPGDWTVLVFNDIKSVLPERIHELSSTYRIVYCCVMEGPMLSFSFESADGELQWKVEHDGNADPTNVSLFGKPPDAFTAIFEEYDNRQGGETGVDYLFDVPIELARHVVGFRHDTVSTDWPFTKLTSSFV